MDFAEGQRPWDNQMHTFYDSWYKYMIFMILQRIYSVKFINKLRR